MSRSPVLVYSPRYDFSMLGLERLHPFDARKFSRAWALLRERLGSELDRCWVEPEGPAPDAALRRVRWPATRSR